MTTADATTADLDTGLPDLDNLPYDTYTAPYNTQANLADAVAIMTLANVEELLDVTAHPRTATTGQYTALGFLCTTYELVAHGLDYTFVSLFHALWHRYTDDQMAAIGLGNLRTPERVAALRGTKSANRQVRRAANKVKKAEYARMWEAWQAIFASIDDTPIVANHTKDTRPTIDDVRRGARDPKLKPRTDRKRRVLNAIIAASLIHENTKRFGPDTPLHRGILADHEGHAAFDETHLNYSLGYLPSGQAPGNYMTRRHAHSRQHDGMAPASSGLTLAVAAARPDQPRALPDVCLGADLHHPTGGYTSAVINILDAIEANNVRAPRASSRRQYVIVDGGYSGGTFTRDLTLRQYGAVMKYASNRKTLFELGAVNNPDGTRTPGIYLFNGKILCPGASPAILARTRLELPEMKEQRTPSGDTYYNYDGADLQHHADTVARLNALTMATNGRPQIVDNNPRGGRRKNTTPVEKVMSVTVTCPWVKGTARCPLMSDFDDADTQHLPAVPDAPIDLPLGQRPACCDNESGKMRLNIPMAEFKIWQDLMPGTWEHEDFYTDPRAANERYNSLLKRRNGGPGLERGAITARKAPLQALVVAAAIAVTNRRSIEGWYAALDDTGSAPPPPPGRDKKANRELVLAKYLAAKNRQPTRGRSAHTAANAPKDTTR
jgi:hypothetical protein